MTPAPGDRAAPEGATRPLPTSRDPFAGVPTGTLGMTVFLISLSVLFAATMIGYLIMIIVLGSERDAVDPLTGEAVTLGGTPDLPSLPAILWLSTIVILLSSASIQWAKSSVRRGAQTGLRLGLAFTLVLAFVFLAMQTFAWFDWFNRAVGLYEEKAYRFAVTSFFVLSGIHALHLIGGVIPMIVITINAFRGKYSADRHNAVGHLALYWHFLDVVWVIMFAALLVLS